MESIGRKRARFQQKTVFYQTEFRVFTSDLLAFLMDVRILHLEDLYPI